MSFYEIEGSMVHVIEMNQSAKEPIILVHGLFTNLSIFRFGAAAALAKRHRVILYDLRGHGLSARKENNFRLSSLSDDLIALADSFDAKQFHLVGYSYGALISLATAVRYPQRVGRLALLDAPGLWEPEFTDIRQDDTSRSWAGVIAKYAQSTGLPILAQNEDDIRSRYEWIVGSEHFQDALLEDKLYLEYIPMDSLREPVLLLYGKKSPYLSNGRRLAERIPRSRFVLIPGDHNFPLQSPLQFHRHLRRFFRS